MITPRNHQEADPQNEARIRELAAKHHAAYPGTKDAQEFRGDTLRDFCDRHKLPIPPPAVVDELNRRTIHGPHAQGQGAAEQWQALYQREVAHGQRMRRMRRIALIVGLLNGIGIGIGLCLEVLIRTLLP